MTTASAVVVDFQTLEQNNASYNQQGNSYQEDGFTLTSVGHAGLITIGTSQTYYAGSTAMLNDGFNNNSVLTKTGGGTFDIFSIDLAEMFNGQADVTFVGEKTGGVTDNIVFTLDGVLNQFETFYFTSFFSDLTSLTWQQVSPYHQYDNITLDVSVVPLPAALPLYGAGLAVLGFAGWRQRKKRS